LGNPAAAVFNFGSGFQPLLQRVEFIGEALRPARAELGEVFAADGQAIFQTLKNNPCRNSKPLKNRK